MYDACEPDPGVNETEQLATSELTGTREQLEGRLRLEIVGTLENEMVPLGVEVELVSVTVAVQLTEEPVIPEEGEQATTVVVILLTAVK